MPAQLVQEVPKSQIISCLHGSERCQDLGRQPQGQRHAGNSVAAMGRPAAGGNRRVQVRDMNK